MRNDFPIQNQVTRSGPEGQSQKISLFSLPIKKFEITDIFLSQGSKELSVQEQTEAGQ